MLQIFDQIKSVYEPIGRKILNSNGIGTKELCMRTPFHHRLCFNFLHIMVIKWKHCYSFLPIHRLIWLLNQKVELKVSKILNAWVIPFQMVSVVTVKLELVDFSPLRKKPEEVSSVVLLPPPNAGKS